MVPFREASYRSQVSRLRRLAVKALQEFPVEVSSFKLLKHGENTTFRVNAESGDRYVLRIHRADYHTASQLREELEWMKNVSDATGIRVPAPLRSVSGPFLVEVMHPLMDTPRNCDLLEWVEGRFLVRGLRRKHLRLLGQTAARLHESSVAPSGLTRHYWSTQGLLGKGATFGAVTDLQAAPPEQQQLINQLAKKLTPKLRAFEERFPERLGLIHADLHFDNVLWTESDMGVIDFDDCGYGFFMYDLAVPLNWLIGVKSLTDERKALLKEALLEGYADIRPLDECDLEILEVLILTRELVLLGWFESRRDNPKLYEQMKRYLKHSVEFLSSRQDVWNP